MIVERQDAEGRGKAMVENLATDLRADFPGVGGLSASNVWRMKVFVAYQGVEKLAPLVRLTQEKIARPLPPNPRTGRAV